MRYPNETYADLRDQAVEFRREAHRHEPGTREWTRLTRMAQQRENECARRDQVVAGQSDHALPYKD